MAEPVSFGEPNFLFRRSGVMPQSIRLETIVPPGFDDTHAMWADRGRQAVLALENEVRKKLRAEGRRVLGRKAVLATSAFERPKTLEPRRTLRPFIACKDKHRSIDAIRALRRFRAAYREARERFVHGLRDIGFPAGTFGLRQLGVILAAST